MPVRDMISDRINALGAYLFAEIDETKGRLKKEGVDVIDLAIGDPDQPTPQHIVDVMKDKLEESSYHRYPSYIGHPDFRQGVASYMEDRFNVSLHADKHVLALVGSKEGIANWPLTVINPGDAALYPEPGYPVYKTSIEFAGGEALAFSLHEDHDFCPDLGKFSSADLDRAKFMYINYPNNPTGASLPRELAQDLIDLAERHDFILVQDAAYVDVVLSGEDPISLLSLKGGMDRVVEFHSLSKPFNMTGWRLAFAVGNQDLISAFKKVKNNIDSGAFTAIQMAGIAALENWQSTRESVKNLYGPRWEMVHETLNQMKIEHRTPYSTFYVWAKVPHGYKSAGFAKKVLAECGVCVTPGTGFGPSGEGYFRISLTETSSRIEEAMNRLRELEF